MTAEELNQVVLIERLLVVDYTGDFRRDGINGRMFKDLKGHVWFLSNEDARAFPEKASLNPSNLWEQTGFSSLTRPKPVSA
jgi:hypothetical protein